MCLLFQLEQDVSHLRDVSGLQLFWFNCFLKKIQIGAGRDLLLGSSGKESGVCFSEGEAEEFLEASKMKSEKVYIYIPVV